MSGDKGLQAKALTFSYGDLPVLEGVDLAVQEGEVCFLVGPNGSGKSTLLALLAGVLTPAAGRIVWRGTPLADLDPADRATQLGWLPQSASESFGFTVEETVALGLEVGRSGLALPGPEDLTLTKVTLERMGLADLADRPLGTLSGGERQRALLAAVLIGTPAALLLDEPTAALDPHHAIMVMEELTPLARDGHTVLVVTHDLNLASLYADRIHLLSTRRILASGTPGEVLRAEVVERAYGSGTVVATHPDSGRPIVLPARPEQGGEA